MLENIEQITKVNKSIDNWKNSIDPFPLELKPISDSLIGTETMLYLTPEVKEYFTEVLSNKLESLKLSAGEIKDISTQIFDSVKENIKNVSEKLGDKTPNFNTSAILRSAGVNAGIGGVFGSTAGGIGAIPGAVIGGVSGASGEISRQIAIHNGSSELVAAGIQVGIEKVTGIGLIKLAGTNIGKSLISNTNNISDVVKSTRVAEVVVDKVDDVARFTGDKMKALEFDMKGLINDAKVHNFIDGKGEKFFAKMDEVIDATRTIKMPYLGSDLKNTNSAGYLRDSSKFAKQYLEEFSETLSKTNQLRAELGKAPFVDKQWIKFNPNHKSFLGQTLHHHHINNTGIVGYLPEKLHNGAINKLAVHVDEMKFGEELSSLIKSTISRI